MSSEGIGAPTGTIPRGEIGGGGPWQAAALLRLVPRVVRDWAYDLFARNRYRMFGRRDACRLPSAEERARFIP